MIWLIIGAVLLTAAAWALVLALSWPLWIAILVTLTLLAIVGVVITFRVITARRRGAIVRMMERPDSTPLLAGLGVPVQVIVGDEDVLTPVEESRKIAEAIPGARLDVIAGAGHLSNLEQPERFNAVLSAFLASL